MEAADRDSECCIQISEGHSFLELAGDHELREGRDPDHRAKEEEAGGKQTGVARLDEKLDKCATEGAVAVQTDVRASVARVGYLYSARVFAVWQDPGQIRPSSNSLIDIFHRSISI